MKPRENKPIKVLIVDDSPLMRDLLAYILSSDPEIRVVGLAGNGKEAIQAVHVEKPDVVVMDVIMPVMDGLDATRIIMETTPTPIVIVSASYNPLELERTFRVMEAGALAALDKPVAVPHPEYERLRQEFIRTVKLMSEVKVIRRRPREGKGTTVAGAEKIEGASLVPSGLKAVVIGASTGGPQAVREILIGLRKDFPVPVLIVQHIAAGFVRGFTDWLASVSGLPVEIAVHGRLPLPGHVYIAPDNFQMELGKDGKMALRKGELENGLRPSVSWLFRSAAEVFGKNVIAILLTGMGRDGARELKLLRDKGAVTIAQDRESSVVYGMPGEAVALNACTLVLPPAKIAEFLSSFRMGNMDRPKAEAIPKKSYAVSKNP